MVCQGGLRDAAVVTKFASVWFLPLMDPSHVVNKGGLLTRCIITEIALVRFFVLVNNLGICRSGH